MFRLEGALPQHAGSTEKTPQARYQARRRRAASAVTFFVDDKDLLRAAIRQSGLTQQDWLAAAAKEKAGRQLHALIELAINQFGPTCFGNVRLTGNDGSDLPLIIDRLRKYGGMNGWRLASEIRDLAGEVGTLWR